MPRFRKRYARRRPRRTGGTYKGIKSYPAKSWINFNRKLNVNTGLHMFKRTCTLLTGNTNITVSAGVGGAMSQSADSWDFNTGTTAVATYFSWANFFTLGMLPSFSEYGVLFDQYKINKIKLKITPYSTASNLQSGTTGLNNQGAACILHSVVDYDDATQFPASTVGIDAMRQYPSYKTRNFFQFGKPIKRYFTPHIAQAAYGSGVFTSYANVGPKWIDMVSTNVEHYGTKFIAEVFQPDTTIPIFIWFKMEATLYFSCKNPR